MSTQVSHHFKNGLQVGCAFVDDSSQYASLQLRETGDVPDPMLPNPVYPTHPSLFFYSVEDIETLVSALQKLGNEFAAVQPERELPAEAYAVEIAKVDAAAEKIAVPAELVGAGA